MTADEFTPAASQNATNSKAEPAEDQLPDDVFIPADARFVRSDQAGEIVASWHFETDEQPTSVIAKVREAMTTKGWVERSSPEETDAFVDFKKGKRKTLYYIARGPDCDVYEIMVVSGEWQGRLAIQTDPCVWDVYPD